MSVVTLTSFTSTFLAGLWPGQPLGVLEGWNVKDYSGRLRLSHPLGGNEVLYLDVGVEGERSGSLTLGRGWDEGGLVRRRMVHAFCDEGGFGVRKFESDPPPGTMGRAPQYLVKAEFSRRTTRRKTLPTLDLEVARPAPPYGWDPFYGHIPSLRVSAKPVSVAGLVLSPPRGLWGERDILRARGDVMRRYLGGDEFSIDVPRLTRRFLRRWKDLSVAEVLGLALAVSDRLRLSFQDRAVLDWGVSVMVGGVATPPEDSVLATSALFLSGSKGRG